MCCGTVYPDEIISKRCTNNLARVRVCVCTKPVTIRLKTVCVNALWKRERDNAVMSYIRYYYGQHKSGVELGSEPLWFLSRTLKLFEARKDVWGRTEWTVKIFSEPLWENVLLRCENWVAHSEGCEAGSCGRSCPPSVSIQEHNHLPTFTLLAYV
jgi:hypothetical protein